MNRIGVALFAFVAAAFKASGPAWACATCFGDVDDPQTHGMNAAILTLLGVTYTLFAAMAGTAFFLWRKSRAAATLAAADESEPHRG